ncbi:hypothetical protein R1sor_021262 [Riccia sorocarpa]|uniref:Uncharacterized protein n=1 Tax=Riccia sorocarpa TaxID=122646 RepID=A0ABD3GI16_9MARC
MHLTVTFLALHIPDPEQPGTSGRDFHGTGDHEMSNLDDQPGTSGGDLHESGDPYHTYDIPNVDVDLGIREDDAVVADGLQGIVEPYDTAKDPSGDDFENHADPDDFENISGDDQNEQNINNVAGDHQSTQDIDNNRGIAEDSGRAGPSRTRPVTEEEVVALERKRNSLWWEVDLLETKKIRFEMEKEELKAVVARNDSELMTAVKKLEGVQGELDNKVRSKQELEEEIAQKEAFWERYMKTLQLQIDGKKRSLHVLTAEVASAKRESAKIPRFSIASCPLNIELATDAVDADRYNSLLVHARHVELLLKTFREVPVQSNVLFIVVVA